jgi:hypothetical protein
MTSYKDLGKAEQYLFNKIDKDILYLSNNDKVNLLTALLDKYLSEVLK